MRRAAKRDAQVSDGDIRKGLQHLSWRRSKYGARQTTVDGIRFHSAKEARRYGELKLLEQAGEIADLTLQPKFLLLVATLQQNDVKLGEYIADFQYRPVLDRVWATDGLGRKFSQSVTWGAMIIEDVKGFKTDLYRWKKKHVEAQYGITIRET